MSEIPHIPVLPSRNHQRQHHPLCRSRMVRLPRLRHLQVEVPPRVSGSHWITPIHGSTERHRIYREVRCGAGKFHNVPPKEHHGRCSREATNRVTTRPSSSSDGSTTDSSTGFVPDPVASLLSTIINKLSFANASNPCVPATTAAGSRPSPVLPGLQCHALPLGPRGALDTRLQASDE